MTNYSPHLTFFPYIDCTVAISLSIWLSWLEPRLVVKSAEISDFFPIDKSFLELLWLPDAYIYNLQSIKQHSFIHNFDGLLLINNTFGGGQAKNMGIVLFFHGFNNEKLLCSIF